MVDFSGGYVPPGVYIDTESTGAFASVGIGSTVVCLVGPGLGHETITDNLDFSSLAAVALSKKFVDPSSIVVSAVLDSGPKTFALTTDYTVATDASNVTTITRVSGGTIPTDRLVQVTYNYADDDYFALNKFSDFATLTSVYGNPLDPTTGDIQSPLSFAAQQAFRNGADVIYCVAPDTRATGTAQEQLATAYSKTLDNYEINLVVPVWPDVQDSASAISYASDLSAHVNAAAAANKPRMGFCGVGAGYTTNDIDTVATAVKNKRVVIFYPQSFTYFNGVLNSSAVADGYYIAAAAAGVMVAQDVNRGLTHSTINSFTGIPSGVGGTVSLRNTWSSRGVSVAEINRMGALIIRHGVTTDVSDIGTKEISIVRCQDALYETIAITLETADLIGDPITSDTPANIKGLIVGALENALAEDVIQGYTDITATQGVGPSGDPTVITVTFSYYPTYPLNYVTVTFTLDLSTGNLTSTSSADNSGLITTA